jgi:hypothetical protein
MPGTTNPQHGVQAFWSQIQALIGRVTNLETWMRSGSGYVPLAYASGYSDYDGGGVGGHELGTWLRDPFGMIHLQGAIKKSSAWVPNETVATLPPGARPDSLVNVICRGTDATAGDFIARCGINASGAIVLGGAIAPTIATPATLTLLSFANVAPFRQGN